MTREVVTRLLRDEVNKTLDDGKSAKKFKLLAKYLHRITRMRDRITNDEFNYWLNRSYDAIKLARDINYYDHRFSYGKIANNSYSDISTVINEMEDRFGWRSIKK